MRGIIKELEKQVRSLQKENRELSKQKHIFIKDSQDDDDIAQDSEDTYIKPKKRCKSCGKGFLEEFEIMGKIFGTCNICEHREKLK